jgi:hypothetical protein
MGSLTLVDSGLQVLHTETGQAAAVALIAGVLSESAARGGIDAVA